MAKSNKMKSARRLITGLKITWTEVAESAKERAGHITAAVITHKNPVFRVLAEQMWIDYGDRIYSTMPMLWRVKMGAVYITDIGDEIIEEFEVVEHMKLDALGHAVQPAIDDTQLVVETEDGQPVELTEFRYWIECLGNRQKRDTDFLL